MLHDVDDPTLHVLAGGLVRPPRVEGLWIVDSGKRSCKIARSIFGSGDSFFASFLGLCNEALELDGLLDFSSCHSRYSWHTDLGKTLPMPVTQPCPPPLRHG